MKKNYEEMYKALCAKNQQLAEELKNTKSENYGLKVLLAKYPTSEHISELERKVIRLEASLKEEKARACAAEEELYKLKSQKALLRKLKNEAAV